MARKELPQGVYAYKAGGKTLYRAAWRTSNGKQQTKRGFPSAGAATKHRREQMSRADRGELVAGAGTFAEYIDGWLLARKPYLEGSTWRDYEINVRLRLKPFFGRMRLVKIERPDVQDYIAQVSAEGKLSPKTINNSIACLAVALADALDAGLVAKNVAAGRKGARGRGIKLPYDKPEMAYLELYEIPAYTAAASDRYRPIAELLIATGLRLSEVCALRIRDLRFNDEETAIRVLRSRKKGDREGSTKGDRWRTVEIGERLVGILRDHLAREGELRDLDPDAYVFVRRGPKVIKVGQPLSRFGLRDWHDQTARRIGRPDLRAHDLRHTAVASWIACNLPLVYVQKQIGHTRYQTTVDEYGHLERSFMQDAPARVEAAIWQEA